MGVDAVITFTASRLLSDDELQDMCYRYHDMFPHIAWVKRQGTRDTGPIKRHCISQIPSSRYPESPVYQFHTTARYYGKHYARGPWPKLAGVIKCLQMEPQVINVFYGGDHGDRPHRMCQKRYDAIWKYFREKGHTEYNRVSEDNLCPDCGGPMYESEWRNKETLHTCPGCGYSDSKAERADHE